MPALTARAIDAHKPKARSYKITIDRSVQLRIAPNGLRTVLVRYTVKGTEDERQYTLPQEYGDSPGQIKLADACAEGQRIRALARAGIDWPGEEDDHDHALLRANGWGRQRVVRDAKGDRTWTPQYRKHL